jgi:WD40 repeat protein
VRLKPGFRTGASIRSRFDDRGERLATIGRRITVWDVSHRTRIGTGPHLRHVSHVGYSPDGKLLAAKNTAGDVLVVDAGSLTERGRYPGNPYGEGTGIHFSPCGRYLVDGSWNGHLLVRDAGSGAVVWREFHAGAMVSQLVRTRDRQVWAYTRQVVGATDDELYLRAWPFDHHEPRVLMRKANLNAAAISADARHIALADTATLETWQVDPHGPPTLTARHTGLPSSGTGVTLAWSPDGSTLAYAGGGTLRVFSAELEPLYELPMHYVSDVDWSADGRLLAAGDWSAGVMLPWPPPDPHREG